MLGNEGPFVLLEDARECDAGLSRLYRAPIAIIEARQAQDIPAAFDQLRTATADGCHAAGFIGYEAGYALEARVASLARDAGDDDTPLLWFGLFEQVTLLDQDEIAAQFPPAGGGYAQTPDPRIGPDAYLAAFAKVAGYIEAGDIYQANLSFRADVPVIGDPLSLHARMSAASKAGWGGVIFTGRHWLLSCSPELFFTLDGRALVTRPMKGTAQRKANDAEDAAAARALVADTKERAENLMIVDLLRNDLSRVSDAGSVAVPELFTVETYPTIHTLTSTVTGTLSDGKDAIDVLAALFPCGSVTGAPKIRAMEIIAEVEDDPRGPYTGSIGWVDPAGNAAFNVAIRTLVLEQGKQNATIGLGSGVVADSTALGEWRECLAKGAFVTTGAPPFDLIETMRFDPELGVIDLDRHLGRMKSSADALGFAFDRHTARNELQAATFGLRDARTLRLRLSRTGTIAIEVRAAPPAVHDSVTVAIVSRPVPAGDFRLAHKTSDRALYDEARIARGTFEIAFIDADGRLTEGSFTNLFADRDGMLITPPLKRGLLPGILRQRLIEEGRAVEGDLHPDDIAKGFFIGNALRGLVRATLV